MSTTAPANLELQSRLGHILERLADAIRPKVPTVRMVVEHGRNDSFPWWTVARFSNGADQTRVIDVSIDCQVAAQGITVRADVAREDGAVLQELPVLVNRPLANGMQASTIPEDLLVQVEGFLAQQADCIAQELAS